ncbi:hypothetical protein B0J11DRAFT_322703 [Dendryphion nanum]|uniref:Uncharacterized protein n=1 Tax=Dendryphion nanum TaxID=256645 RepID=A0A9P9DRQ7_9PLEO|nr:hypothetical protein B0J11DRAFT_322703 [Dendryphion nanum]
MAKKKGKKAAQKVVEWTSPPESPKKAPEEPLAVPEPAPLSPETTATDTTTTDTTQYESAQSHPSPIEANFVDLPDEAPLPESSTQVVSAPVEDDVLAEPQTSNITPPEDKKADQSPDPAPSAALDTSTPEDTPSSDKVLAAETAEQADPIVVETIETPTTIKETTSSELEQADTTPTESPKKEPESVQASLVESDQVETKTVEEKAVEIETVESAPSEPEVQKPESAIAISTESEPINPKEEAAIPITEPSTGPVQAVEESKAEPEAAREVEPVVTSPLPEIESSSTSEAVADPVPDNTEVAEPEPTPEPVAESVPETIPEPVRTPEDPPSVRSADHVINEASAQVPESVPESVQEILPAKVSESVKEVPSASIPESVRDLPSATVPESVQEEVPPTRVPESVESAPPAKAPEKVQEVVTPKAPEVPSSPSPSSTSRTSRTSRASRISRTFSAEIPPPKSASSQASIGSRSPPKPQALKEVIQESRPPAPSPPVRRARPRLTSAFEDTEDDTEDDSALIHPRLRGDPHSRDPTRGLSYPPQQSQHRSLFASRVPPEHYTSPPQPQPPPPPPPGYHPRYHQPTAPPYYPNHNYSMSQSGSYSNHSNHNPYGPPSHSSSPYQESWNQFPPNYPPYGSPGMHRQDSMGSREFPLGPPSLENGPVMEEDGGELFSRISQAIPDLHSLLARYKETHGQLGVREELLRRTSLEQQERLRIKDDEIANLKERMSNMEHKHSSEASRLRLEIGNMEEQVKELKEELLEIDRLRKEAEETRTALEAAKASWEVKQKDLESAHAELQRTAAEEKERAQAEFAEWKTTATTKHDAEKIALAIQFDKRLKEADVLAENQRQEAAAAFVREKDELRSEHQRQQRERESSFDRVRKELESKLTTAQIDREEALKHERESREVWEAERETLTKSHQEDQESLQRSWDEQREVMETKHKKIKDESDKAWIELHADANRKAEEEKAKVEKLTKELEELQKKFDELKAENEKEKSIIRSVAGNLESERSRLEKLMECYGDIAEIKSKGDTYYLVSFSQLQKQIVDLAVTHFKYLPITPPPEVLENIPPELPSFLGNTDASRQLRAAYVVHTVSAMVTFRVFGPFLFSLGRRYDKADSLFQSMSNHIRDKSTRKEAIWRQQTLLAAFTSSGAKQRINTAAGTVVDEIVTAVKHFADPKEEEGIKIAVRRIVKLAAETWRFARLEREMISATMPALQDDSHDFTGPDYWPAYKPDDTPIASLAGTSAVVDDKPKLLLRLFPVIHREPKHENFRSADDGKPDEGCIYHYGLALYDEARCVETRKEEIRSAGL